MLHFEQLAPDRPIRFCSPNTTRMGGPLYKLRITGSIAKKILRCPGWLIGGGSPMPLWLEMAFSWSTWMKSSVGLAKPFAAPPSTNISNKKVSWQGIIKNKKFFLTFFYKWTNLQTRWAELFTDWFVHKVRFRIPLMITMSSYIHLWEDATASTKEGELAVAFKFYFLSFWFWPRL